MSWFWGAYNASETVEGPADSEADFQIGNPGVKVIEGPFGSQQAADNWASAHPDWPASAFKHGGNGGGGGTSGGGPGGGAGSGGSRQDIVNEALNSIGHAYHFGGAPGINGDQPWDCSSCVNDNIGRVNRLSIPGYPDGSYDGSAHGPSTIGWLDAQGGIVGSIDRSLAIGGDIACWRTHMGIFINPDEMVSAANPTDGTIRSGVDGFISGEQLVVLRLAHFGPGGITLPVPTIGSDAHLGQLTRQIALSDKNLVARRMQIARIGKGRF